MTFLIVHGLFLRNIVNNNKNKQVPRNSFLFLVVSVHKNFDVEMLVHFFFLSCHDEGQSCFSKTPEKSNIEDCERKEIL